MIILEFLILICCFYLVFPLATSILAAILPSPVRPVEKIGCKSNFACVITVYKDLDIAWPLVVSLLNQRYPMFHIYLVADAVKAAKAEITDRKLTLLIPDQPLNSKVASLDYALKSMYKSHTHVVVFDPDNLVPDHFLRVLDRYHQSGFDLVQGKRIAKNIDTTYAALDALGEYYYDFSVRNTPYKLGSSSTIAGSGMSIRKDLYLENISKEMEELERKGLVVSEDKALQLQMVSRGYRIAYAPAAIVFDEKISASHQIGRQRGRWLNSYFRHSLESLKALGKGILHVDWNLVLFSITVLMPPMIVLIGGAFLLMFVGLMVNPYFAEWLFVSLVLFVVGFLIVLLLNRTPKAVMKAIPKIPLFVLGQVSGFVNIGKANRDFMVTDHDYRVSIDETWDARKKEFSHLGKWWK